MTADEAQWAQTRHKVTQFLIELVLFIGAIGAVIVSVLFLSKNTTNEWLALIKGKLASKEVIYKLSSIAFI